MPKNEIPEGIYFGLPEDEYHAAAGLSCSGMKQLSVSPLNYWHHNSNPAFERPEESFPMRFGKAVHCRLLEPERFHQMYCRELSVEDYPGALQTIDHMKEWLSDHGMPTTSKRKQDLIDRIVASDHPAMIWDDLKGRHAEENAGKAVITKGEAELIEALAAVAAADPVVSAIFIGGMPEVSFFVEDPETGVMLKARMDYVRPRSTMDLKTFSNSRGKPVEKAVFEAIYHESYHLQCVYYHKVRELARRKLAAGAIQTHGFVSEAWLKTFTEQEDAGFGFVFVESSPPFDMRLILLKQAESPGADLNVYWSAAAMKIYDATQLYAECLAKYGQDPWRDQVKPHLLEDTDLPQLMFA
ncbi:PD-(D/E)XK nuclease-like domain-containing protein [Zavarzinella formosa]|uniref:PD-(D/E)XK nuclease-like domain-containing protein n=1 Tax=Zavarzinella formosa TaxID=360055 RepID=UPI0002F9A0CB|nr:PD-(D/E)XK nuclease-like domain-containing protein [Zavarzinella formosa]